MAERAGWSFEVRAKVEAGGGGASGKRQSGDGASGAKGGSVAGWIAKTFNVRGKCLPISPVRSVTCVFGLDSTPVNETTPFACSRIKIN
jgi:hypothetical protein